MSTSHGKMKVKAASIPGMSIISPATEPRYLYTGNGLEATKIAAPSLGAGRQKEAVPGHNDY
jgi:hypothetical protein